MAESEDLNVSVMQLQPSLFEAWAKKQGGSVKSWKRRWFVLKPTRLWYFKAKNSTSAQGFIELTPQTTVQEETEMNVPGKKFFFSIDSRNQKGNRKFIFCVDNEVYLREFLKRIFEAVHSQQPQQSNIIKPSIAASQKVEETKLSPITLGASQPAPSTSNQTQNSSQPNLMQSTPVISSKPQGQAPKPQKKSGWVVTRPTISGNNPQLTESSDNKDQVQQDLEDIKRLEEEKRMEKFRQQQQDYLKMQQDEEKKRIEEEIQRQMEEQQREEELKVRDQQEMLRQQEELLKQQEIQRQLEEQEIQRRNKEEQEQLERNKLLEKAKQQEVCIQKEDQKQNEDNSSSSSEEGDGEEITLQNVIAFVQAFEWVDENAQEFIQLFYDNIPRASPTHLSASVNPNGSEIFVRCTSPLKELKAVLEFFNQVGSPEDQIEKLKIEAGRNGVLAVESWISLSEKGGCDAGWNIIAEHDSLDVIQDISDPSEIDSVGIIKLWCETNHVDFVHRFGRDMGDQPPYNTEFWMDIPLNQIEMIQSAATAFMFPEIPQEILDSCMDNRVMVKVVTSEDGFVKFSIIIERIQEQEIRKCIEFMQEDPVNVLNLQQLLNIKIEGFEYTFLNEGFGYDVYIEGAKTSVVFKMGCF